MTAAHIVDAHWSFGDMHLCENYLGYERTRDEMYGICADRTEREPAVQKHGKTVLVREHNVRVWWRDRTE